MTRLNLMLLGIAIACALGVVTSQHEARKLFVELQKQQEMTRRLGDDFGRLQLEQSTWAMHGRVERIARDQLGMRVPAASRVQIVPATPAASREAP